MTNMTTTHQPDDPSQEYRPPDTESAGSVFDWIGHRIRLIAVVGIVLAIVLGAAGFAIRLADKLANGPDQPAFNPGGEIYDLQERAGDLFDPATEVLTTMFFVESPNPTTGDVLTQSALSEFLANSEALKADPESQKHLTST
ncbi:MAG: hypothetical protein GY939_19745, partial [Actinomycetia bacterium]|nr:hypothetical protein [Actinomycetes bacterium]